MIRITFTIGIGKDKDGREISPAERVLFTKRACAMVAREFGGYTATTAVGGWVAPNGELIEEESLVISAVTETPGNYEAAKELAKVFKGLFNQACVMVTREVVNREFV